MQQLHTTHHKSSKNNENGDQIQAQTRTFTFLESSKYSNNEWECVKSYKARKCFNLESVVRVKINLRHNLEKSKKFTFSAKCGLP